MKLSFLAVPLFIGALAPLLAAPPADGRASVFKNRPPLAPNAYYPLPLGAVRPKGWLRDQLLIQASGLTGHLDEFWPDLGPNSAWLGGSGEGWERGPYYLDGLVPLAYLLDDPKLIAKARPWIEWTLKSQRPDGALGPEKNTDWWPLFVMLKVLTQYQEATGDPRVIPAMERYFAYQARHIRERPLREWAIYRWHDEVLSLLWLYNRNGDARLLDLARTLKAQGHDWGGQFVGFRHTARVVKPDLNLSTHGVNNAMGLKADALWSVVSNAPQDRERALNMLRMLDRYHGQPTGMFSSDEHYAGTDPSQGVELCTVVEAMFSLALNTAILGDLSLADRLEKITYNALSATITADHWAHQYDQQPNQVMCSLSRRNWASNGPESNLFGLEPNFGCCTANMHQGWPKFAAHTWMATPDDGLAVIAYAPSQVTATVKGTAVTIDEETEYPFRDTVRLAVNPASPVAFPLVVRIPAWATGARVTVNGQPTVGVRAGTFHRIDRQWQKGDRVELVFPMKLTVVKGHNDSVSVERGPLVYALAVGESWRKLKQTGPATDWEVFPTTPWNYALSVNPANPEASLTVQERPLGRQPFSLEGAPVILQAKGRRLPEWQLVNDSAGPLPASPVQSKLPEETLTLLPYGAARLRITSFPLLSGAASQANTSKNPLL